MVTDFIAVIAEMRNGQVAADISRKLNELMDAIRDTGGPGALTLKLKVKPSTIDIHEGVKEVEITHSCEITKPEKPIGKAIFFVSRDGNLTRTDPDQQELFEQEESNAR